MEPTPPNRDARERLAVALARDDLSNLDACTATSRYLLHALARGDLGDAVRHGFNLVDDLDRTRRGLAARARIEAQAEREAGR